MGLVDMCKLYRDVATHSFGRHRRGSIHLDGVAINDVSCLMCMLFLLLKSLTAKRGKYFCAH